jgi:hypothetical protein
MVGRAVLIYWSEGADRERSFTASIRTLMKGVAELSRPVRGALFAFGYRLGGVVPVRLGPQTRRALGGCVVLLDDFFRVRYGLCAA